MARPRIILHGNGVRALLNDPGVTAHLEGRMASALAAAQASAPVETGAYRAGLHTWVEKHATRTVVHMGSSAPHALAVEARFGVLIRAMGAAA